MPGYPAKDDAPIRESDYEGREVKEIDFQTTDLRLGQFRAMDFFGDGSFYLLDAPGVSFTRLDRSVETGLCTD